MMFSRLFFLVPVLFAFPSVGMRWTDNARKAVALSLEGLDSRWEKCVESGLQARYRMEVKLCRKRSMWFDECLESEKVSRSMEKDPVSGMVKVSEDFLTDTSEPEAQGFETYGEALSAMLAPIEISFQKLGTEEPEMMANKKAYLRVRATSACRGDVSPTVRRLSQFLSFGLIDLQDKASGWSDFKLE